jgi:formylglycine-generating enzyme required for sulfatase activity
MSRNFRVIFIFYCNVFSYLEICAQTVQNVYATQDGNHILVNYTLDASSPCEVSLFLSFDNGVSWQPLLTDCTGDLGKNIMGGQKQIKWNVLANRDQLVGKGFIFKIKANGRKEFEPEMVFVEGGTFQMGSNLGGSDEQPVHSVVLSSFSMGKYEVTQAQWKAVMGNNPSIFSGCDLCPVENVSRIDVQLFITTLNQLTGKTYRLPTESEWEYAARGGKNSRGFIYCGSNQIATVAWYDYNSESRTHEVGGKKGNELGLYDMTGNVSEWCSDYYGSYSQSAYTNPQGPSDGLERVVRGGSYSVSDSVCLLSFRQMTYAAYGNHRIGFRLVLP